MAINKNFVVKNGLEVNTNLLVADSDNTRVGVATTSPDYLLHVNGGIGATNLTVTGFSTLSGLSTFQSGFFVNGISTHIGVGTFRDDVYIDGTLFVGGIDIISATGGGTVIGTDVNIQRNLSVGGITTVTGGPLIVGGGTSTGTADQVLQVTGINSGGYIGGNLGIGETNPTSKLQVSGDVLVTGVGTFLSNVNVGGALTAASVIAGNEGLSVAGVSTFTGDVDADANLNVAGVSTFTGNITASADLDVDGHTELDNLNVSGLSTFVGIVTTQSDLFVGGDLFISEDLVLDTNLNILGIATIGTLDITNNSTFGGDIDVDGHTELDNLNVSGLSTFVGFSTFNDSVFVQDNLSVGGITTSNSYTIDGTTVISSGRELQNIASLDATTTATIESAIANAPNTFTDLKVTGITTLGIASATDFTADNINVTGVTTTNILAVTGIATAETLQVGNLGLSVTGVSTLSSVIVGSAVTINNTGVNITGVATVNSVEITGGSSIGLDVVTRNINASGVSTFVGFATFSDSVFVQDNLSVGGITTSNSYTIDGTTVITSGRELQNIASLDATTTATIESAIANAPNTFTDLKVTGITTLGIASATDFTADNVNVSLATTTNILAVTGIATAETLQVGDQGLSVAGVTTTLTLEVGVVGNTLVGITTILDEDDLSSDSDTALATQQSIKAYVDSTVSGVGDTANVSTSTLVVAGVTTQTGDLIVGVSTFFVDVSNGGVGVGTDNPNPQAFGPQFKVFGNNPIISIEDDGGGDNAFGFIRQNTNTLQIVTGDSSGNKIQISKTSDTSSSWGGSNLTNVVTIDQGNIGVGIATATIRDSAKLDVDGAARFNGDVNFAGATGITSAFFDKSDNSLKFSDGVRAKFGDGLDLHIHHDGANSYISDQGTGQLELTSSGTAVEIKKNTGEAMGLFKTDGAVELYYDNSKKFETDNHGVKVTGIMTATGGYNLGIHSAGTEVTTATGIITALDFVGTGNSICFKNQDTTTKVIEINIAGSGGGGGGGVTEVDTNVSSTSATGVGSFAVASFRSAAVIAQIDQTGDYQVGRYLMIHDGTTVTVVEESAVSTGATMLGSFSGAIVGSNAELQVTMGNAGIATVTTKIDTVTV